ncbi:choice-of-anchor Q domain-containing protein [Teichococcus oryzae]|uniref:Right-handed parallel beta-helix repeat-containing protein n=1 Tax=Teichococcus oryzae TaxID=1608942 RepID=A0A5B2TID9_9PROT|nr:choice-of-anchor Q domain-containing protein [Pseudoroseomonas oryzae]KAA2213550.1 hypothetical protein F0Q34_09990 [Pseudoroseomonas oryzae]
MAAATVASLLLAAGCGVAISDATPHGQPAGPGYPITASVDATGVRNVTLQAFVRDRPVPMTRDPGDARLWHGVHDATCARGFPLRYVASYDLLLGRGSTAEPRVGSRQIWAAPPSAADCPGGTAERAFRVNSIQDETDSSPGDGICWTGRRVAGGAAECTLRAAVTEAARLSGLTRITLERGRTYALTRGQLNAAAIMTIEPEPGGGTRPVVQATPGQRVLQILPLPGAPAEDPRSYIELRDIEIRGGTAPGSGTGGGINNLGALFLQRVAISGNAAARGAGIYSAGHLELRDSTIMDNSTENFLGGAGGGVAIGGGTALIAGSTFSGNRSSRLAGGLAVLGGRTDLVNSTLSGNMSEVYGGAIYASPLPGEAPVLRIRNATITRNDVRGSSTERGGGIYQSGDSEVHIANTILAGNTNNRAPAVGGDCVGRLRSWGHNIVGLATSPCEVTGAIGGRPDATDRLGDPSMLDLRLGPLENNGGPTVTHRPLRTGSTQAIDAGHPGAPNNASLPACMTRDQRGIARPRNTACDVGAVEE